MAVAPRLPTPPQPVMPPEGIAPVTQEVGLGAGDDAMSPTTMVLNYLKARGYQPTSENVRRALEANMRDPGVITGLRSDRGATEAEDQAAMAAARGGGGSGGGGSNAEPKIGGPADLGKDPGGFERVLGPLPQGGQPVGGDPNTSAQPSRGDGGADNLMPWLVAGGGGAAALADAILNRSRGPEYVGNAQTPSGRVTDVDLPDPRALPSPTPMDAALNRATGMPPQLPPPQAQIAAPPRPPEAPVAAPGSVIPQPAPVDVRPNIVPPEAIPANRGTRVPQMPPLRGAGSVRPVGPLPMGLGEVLRGFRK